MTPVIIESPYAGDISRNLIYARRAVHHALSLGEAPLASHLLYTQAGILDDDDPEERQWGIEAGLTWLRFAEKQIFYTDYGWSSGMEFARARGQELGIYQEARTIGGNIAT